MRPVRNLNATIAPLWCVGTSEVSAVVEGLRIALRNRVAVLTQWTRVGGSRVDRSVEGRRLGVVLVLVVIGQLIGR